MRNILAVVTVVVSIACPTNLHAQIPLWFNGMHNAGSAVSSERNTAQLNSMLFDNFVVTGDGWRITSIFGEFTEAPGLAFSTADFEIRTGITNGVGGTLVYSGANVSASRQLLSYGFWPVESRIRISGLDLWLAPGAYWLGLAPVGNGAGQAFVMETAGNGASVNANIDGNSFYRDLPSWNYQQPPSLTSFDASYGIDGYLVVVPEPSVYALMAAGLAGLGMVTRRRRRALVA
jgi:PEP-CTERM motif